MVIKEIVKYTCVGNTLPVVMCTLLGTTKTLDELRMSTEVNGNKPHLLINHLKFKGDFCFYHNYVGLITKVFFLCFRKCKRNVDKIGDGSLT